MKPSQETIDAALASYRSAEPLYTVEAEAVETLPAALRDGEYGRRDTQWIVRWYGRRYLGDEPPGVDRRRREEAFEDADVEAVRDAVSAAADADRDGYDHAVAALTALPGVDLPVASAFLAFVHPEEFVVVGPREWDVVSDLTALEEPYPDPPSVGAYDAYLDACDDLADRYGLDPWELYMVLWRLWTDRHAEE